jgi:hypothetical protein
MTNVGNAGFCLPATANAPIIPHPHSRWRARPQLPPHRSAEVLAQNQQRCKGHLPPPGSRQAPAPGLTTAHFKARICFNAANCNYRRPGLHHARPWTVMTAANTVVGQVNMKCDWNRMLAPDKRMWVLASPPIARQAAFGDS